MKGFISLVLIHICVQTSCCVKGEDSEQNVPQRSTPHIPKPHESTHVPKAHMPTHAPKPHTTHIPKHMRCKWWEFWNEETESCWSCLRCYGDRRRVNMSCAHWCINDESWSWSYLNHVQNEKTQTKPVTPTLYTVIHKDDTEHWRRLTWGLAGALSFLIIFVPALYCFQYLRSKRMNTSARIQYVLQDSPDGSGDYVVIHRRPAGVVFTDETDILDPRSISPLPRADMPQTPSRRTRYQWMRRVYRPKRRMMNEYVDDVFESEDSAGSRTSARLPLTTIHERSETESPN